MSTEENPEENKIIRYENTYRLDSQKPFKVDQVEQVIRNVLHSNIEHDTRYDANNCQKMALELSAEIRNKIKMFNFDRYRIICVVTIGERNSQSGIQIMKFLWDADRDKYASYTYENNYLYAVGIVLGIYYE